MGHNHVIYGDALSVLKTIEENSIDCCVTSPPYWQLRDYETAKWKGGSTECSHTEGVSSCSVNDICKECGAVYVDKQIGLEPNIEDYIGKMVEIFREVRRTFKPTGTLFLNLGDTYISEKKGNRLRQKNLAGIPWRVALALQKDGWYLRQDIIWCLSGSTWLYVKSQKGEMPMTVKDIARLDPTTIQLWNGNKWTQLLGMSSNQSKGNELEIILYSGECISCTPTHRFPTKRGLLLASKLIVGDVLCTCLLPEPESAKNCLSDIDIAWLVGLYLAKGSRSEDIVQLTYYNKDTVYLARLREIVKKYGGSLAIIEDGTCQNVMLHGKTLTTIIDIFISGRTAKDKRFNSIVWRYPNSFISIILDGFLSSNSYQDNEHWGISLIRNYKLERDLRTICARLGYSLTLNKASVLRNGQKVAMFHGEIGKQPNNHYNNRSHLEVIAINKARCQKVWSLGVADKPYIFALASGVLTHNSKPNAMPESVRDRCTKSHEYIFLLTKSSKYFWDKAAISEPLVRPNEGNRKKLSRFGGSNKYIETSKQSRLHSGNEYKGTKDKRRNARSVWSIATTPYKKAHYAVFPKEIPRRCISAGCPKDGTVLDPFAGSGTVLQVAQELGRNYIGIELNPENSKLIQERVDIRCQVLLVE